MKLAALVVALVVASLAPTVAMSAKWIPFSVANEHNDLYYLDADSAKKTGQKVRIWTYVEYLKGAVRSGKNVFSQRDYWELDCAEDRYRSLSQTWFSEASNKGEVLQAFGEQTEWAYRPPNTIVEELFKIVCGGAWGDLLPLE